MNNPVVKDSQSSASINKYLSDRNDVIQQTTNQVMTGKYEVIYPGEIFQKY